MKLAALTLSFITLFVNRYNNSFLPLVRQFFFVQNQLNMFVDLRMQYVTACLNQFSCNLISTWRLIRFQLSNSNLNLKKY
jgi:hypothetical protein